ncbi:hypothetical protein EDB89DRAFT_1914720 [Lactarius sanguifluus]|nr:hypothetical protein EDB89DRAFT_1914720 [Lactarius sanguifluus]
MIALPTIAFIPAAAAAAAVVIVNAAAVVIVFVVVAAVVVFFIVVIAPPSLAVVGSPESPSLLSSTSPGLSVLALARRAPIMLRAWGSHWPPGGGGGIEAVRGPRGRLANQLTYERLEMSIGDTMRETEPEMAVKSLTCEGKDESE